MLTCYFRPVAADESRINSFLAFLRGWAEFSIFKISVWISSSCRASHLTILDAREI
jgi:hypothetical protein